ncbi:gibberellin 2-beta-dioxygenase 2-like [Olea europaea subsp. europaea]|uniref:gibberellin 2beta-dioxygenase n=1 Tax=Olea europaea subsp. europaea TaxID=158383 RepID=A0A8S0UT14_OLEEU|nr:gibberellin 2-beta-dioxygenase 2-like [Olea europaea subsp. europaea]
MVVASLNLSKTEKIRDLEIPIIDLSANGSEVSELIVKACEEFGFFKVINHGVPHDVIARMEQQSYEFFSKPASGKQQAGPANPYGYGCKNIGLKGDIGEVEYLLLQTNPVSIDHNSKTISSTDPNKFSSAVRGYVEAVRKLACEILELMEVGLGSPGPSVLSRLIRDVECDSLLRFNHYPKVDDGAASPTSIGFGEHTDPQILTLLRSNGVGGLQISLDDGVWVPVNPHPVSAFFINVGDVLQVMTNGRFLSVRHRVMVNSYKSRMSMAYFTAPPLDATISCLPVLLTPQKPPLYRSFTWAEYKKAAYSLRLGDSRLNHFKARVNDDENST